jgi:HK97 family phage portal protein
MQHLGQAVWTPRRYQNFAEEAYQRNVIAYRAINEVATSATQAPWVLYRVDSQGNKMQLTSHELIDLMRRPNPQQGGAAFIEAVTAFYLIAGNTYMEAIAPDNKPPQELWTLRPDRMKVVAGRTGVAGYEYTINGATKRWAEDEDAVLQIKTFNPLDDWYGQSPIEAAAYSVDLHNATLEWNKALLDNRAQPSGALVYAPKEGSSILDESAYNRLKNQMDEQYTGAKNAGRPMLLEGGMQWQQIGLSPQDMDYINSKNVSARDISLTFGVPPQLMGIPGDNTYANMQEARLALWEQTVLPWLYKLRDELNNWLVPQFGDDLRLDIDEDAISALGSKREAKWEKVNQADFLTINEKREAVGYEPVKGGDQVLAPATLLPIAFSPESETEKSLTAWLIDEQGYSEEKAAEMAALAFQTKETTTDGA